MKDGKETLLEKAKKIPSRKLGRYKATLEDMELAIAWAKDEINVTQIAKVKGWKHHTNVNYWLSYVFKQALNQGIIKFNDKKEVKCISPDVALALERKVKKEMESPLDSALRGIHEKANNDTKIPD